MTYSRLGLALLAFVTAAVVAHARIERTVEKAFSVSPGGLLTISTSGGDVTVTPGAGNEVRVVALLTFRRARTEAEADEVAKDLELTIEQVSGGVTATARSQQSQSMLGWRKGGQAVTVAFRVTVPARYSVDLKTSGGTITVGDLTGRAKVHTSGGNLQFGRFQGPVEGRTSGGNITVGEALERLQLHTSGGDIRIERVSGDVKVDTSGGNIAIGSATGGVDASTSGGDIKVTLPSSPERKVSLSTSGGNVAVKVAAPAAFALDARTSGGRVRVEGVSVLQTGELGRRQHIQGTVNGGGPELRLRTSGGDITVSAL